MNEMIFLASIIECYTENDVLIIGAGDDEFYPCLLYTSDAADE